jgi:hypothetical protein
MTSSQTTLRANAAPTAFMSDDLSDHQTENLAEAASGKWY